MQNSSIVMMCLKLAYHCAAVVVIMNPVRNACDKAGSLNHVVHAFKRLPTHSQAFCDALMPT